MELVRPDERIDDLELEGLKIIQNPEWFCFGIDAVLLSGFARVKKSDHVVDLGTGTGIIPLLIYGKYKPASITGVEIQTEVAEMAQRSVLYNKLEDNINIYKGDIKDCFKALGAGSCEVVTSNPPYKKNTTGLINPDDNKSVSRHELLITLEELIFSAARLLKVGGRLYMVHRPERLRHIILSLESNKLMLKRLRFVHSKAEDKPVMLLIEAVKGGGDFLSVEKPLIIYNSDGTYTEEILKIYGR